MLSSLRNMFRVRDLRNKILFTLFILGVYRLGSFIPVPGIDLEAISALRRDVDEGGGGVLGYLQLFSGGGLTRFAILGLGIMPYITASIIMQILAVVVPKLEEWQQQGAVGQRKITQWTRYLTIAIAILQSTGLVFLFNQGNQGAGLTGSSIVLVPEFNVGRVLLIVLTFTAGTALLMWFGELITQKGIGNGMSLIIFAAVVSDFPSQGSLIEAERGWGGVVFLVAVLVALVFAIVFVELGQRRIPVQFAKRVVGRKQYGGQKTYIPLKVNQSGVIPIIFASSVLYLPLLIAQVLPNSGWGNAIRDWIDSELANPTSIAYLAIFGLLIVFFAYFYTQISFDPVKQADSIRKQGGFIPGIRPGPQTERHLDRILKRITLPGALFIAAVALVPAIVIGLALGSDGGQSSGSAQFFAFGGVSVLIAVGVALETMKQIDSQLMMRNYEGFLQ